MHEPYQLASHSKVVGVGGQKSRIILQSNNLRLTGSCSLARAWLVKCLTHGLGGR